MSTPIPLIPISLADLPPTDPETFEAMEHSYRRGYLHGYSQAMDDLEAGCRQPTWQRVARFFDGALTRWRYGDCSQLVLPPIAPRA